VGGSIHRPALEWAPLTQANESWILNEDYGHLTSPWAKRAAVNRSHREILTCGGRGESEPNVMCRKGDTSARLSALDGGCAGRLERKLLNAVSGVKGT
jgi:hypothetical protein